MTSSSSYVGAQAIPSGTQRMRRLSAAEAAAVMAQHTPRVRYLGVAYPGNNSGSATSTVVTGQFQNPALITNPQRTLNSSISSQPTTAISSGQGEAVGSTGGGITSAAVINGTSLGTTGTADTTGAAAVFSPTAVSGTGVPFGTINTTLSPTVSPTAFSSVTPTGAVAGFPALTAPATATQATTATTATTTATTSATTSATANATVTASNATSATTANRVASPVRIVRNANGRAVITNATTTSNGRNR
ncbi:MAG TPA: hypothetical protein VE974_02495 [Thermoanaerobaculia bacterium]|nr:hypothetical protein [Thermoanaerobaculia bacterium]